MQSGDNAGTSPVSEWPTGTWSTPDVPTSHSAPLVSARVPIGRSSSQRDEVVTEPWPVVATEERAEELTPSEVPGLGERITSLSAVTSPESAAVVPGGWGNPRDRGIALVAAGLSHDLNNLLVGVLGNAELAQAAYLKGEDPSSHLLAIRIAAERASALASGIVRFASDHGSDVSSFDLSDLVGEMVMLAQAGVSKSAQVVRGDNGARGETWASENWPGVPSEQVAGADSNLDESKALLLVKGDPGQIGQVVLNLIINGADALGPDGGEVYIGVEKVSNLPTRMVLKPSHDSAEGFARLRVSDTGAGITPELLPRIFEPFFSTKRQGRGLGLANCLEIVSEHGGGLNVSSAVGRGTTFEVYLPLSAEVRSTTRAQEQPVVPEWRTTGRVLVIDDEPMVARLTAMVLEHVGLKPTIEHTGAGAVERLAHSLTESESNQFRVCVLDLTMPNLSGHELLRQLKTHAPHLPVVLTSGFSEQQLRQRGAFVGFDGFLQKPFRMSAMVDVLRCLLDPT